MKIASQKRVSQKGLSLFFIVVGIAVLGVVAVALFASKNSVKPNNEGLTKTPQQILKNSQKLANQQYDQIESQTYVFYYPKDYIRDELDRDNVLRYRNPNTKMREIENIVLSVLTPKSKPSSRNFPNYQLCARVSEELRRTGEDEIKVEVTSGLIKGVGCKTVVKSKVGDDVMVDVIKSLMYDQGEDYSIYRVRATYLVNASKDEGKKLELSVDQFTLK